MSDITVINDSQQSDLVINGLAKNGELYLKASGSTNAGAIVVYDSGSWRTFANEASSGAWNGNTYSVDFDGSDDALVVGNVSQLTGSSVSVSAWFNLSASPSGEAVIGTGAASTDRGFWLQVVDSDTIRVGNGTNINAFDLPSGTFALNRWYHLVGIIDGTSVEVFIDGSSLGTSTTSTLSGTHGSNLEIGHLPSAAFATNYFQGLLDEVAVWNSALSASDVTTLYNSGTPGDISSLSPVGWWRMGDNDSGTGTTITDQGSGGNDGTLTNGPTFSTDVPT